LLDINSVQSMIYKSCVNCKIRNLRDVLLIKFSQLFLLLLVCFLYFNFVLVGALFVTNVSECFIPEDIEINNDPDILAYLKFQSNLVNLENERVNQKLNISTLNTNIANLISYQASLRPETHPKLEETVSSRINHLKDTLNSLIQKGKNTVAEINTRFQEMLKFRNESLSVQNYLKRKRGEDAGIEKENENENENENEVENENEDENESVKKKRKLSKEKEKEKEKEEESDSHFADEEDIEHYTNMEENERLQSEMQVDDRDEDDDSGEGEGEGDDDEEDDAEFYRNAVCGEMDPSIKPDSRIRVRWKGNDWRRATVKGWNKEARQYEVDYDSDVEPDPLLEHLTGESKEQWEFIPTYTREMRKRTLQAQKVVK
jgi:hypothetical protein